MVNYTITQHFQKSRVNNIVLTYNNPSLSFGWPHNAYWRWDVFSFASLHLLMMLQCSLDQQLIHFCEGLMSAQYAVKYMGAWFSCCFVL